MNYWKTLPLLVALGSAGAHAATPLIHETFDDTSLSSRGWYDSTNQTISKTERIPGSGGSLHYLFKAGATTPTSGGAMRRIFAESDSVYLSYYVKYSSNWVGSGKPYHPHQFHFLTNLSDKWSGLAETNLTVYIEDNGGRMQFVIQDVKNIDQNRINQNLSGITESRGVAGCNGNTDGYGGSDCYRAGSIYRNGKSWKSKNINFTSTQGPGYKGDWHRVETFIKLNSVVNGKGVTDGVVQMWIDDKLVLNHTDILMRTGQHPNMRFNQLAIGPYIGDGSPVEQSFWIDELIVARERPTVAQAKPSAPANVRAVRQ